MTDIRDALRRASGVSETDAVNHNEVQNKAGQIIRRRRAMYSGVSAMAVLVIGFTTFQVAQGNWFGRSEMSGGLQTTPPPPPAPAVLHIEPENPVEGDEIKVFLENTSKRPVTYGIRDGVTYQLEWQSGVTGWVETQGRDLSAEDVAHRVEPGETVMTYVLPVINQGRWRVTIDVTTRNGRAIPVSRTFSVGPVPEGPPLEVTAPNSGEGVASPLTVSGSVTIPSSSDGTHSASQIPVTIRLRGEDGDVLAEKIDSIQCGDGCRAGFQAELSYEAKPQKATVEVSYESSGSDEPYVVEVPVTLLVPENSGPNQDAKRSAIEVNTPRPGMGATSPGVIVEGTANVFEANVRIQILDENGEVIADTFTTATCGSGCRGDFFKQVKFSVDQEQEGTVLVFEESAETGEPINVVEIPVTLVP